MTNIELLPGEHSKTAGGPPEPRLRNKIGLAALVVGVVALVFSLIPFVNFSVGLIGLVGLILGIIGLSRKGLPRGQALAGVILSSVALILAIVMAIVYSLMFIGAVGESLEESFEAEWGIIENDPFNGESIFDDDVDIGDEAVIELVEQEPIPEGELGPDLGIADGAGSADSPLPLGTPIRIMGLSEWEFELRLGPAMLNADEYVAQADARNKPAADGTQYVAVDVTLTYIGSEEMGDPKGVFGLGFVPSDGSEYAARNLKNVNEGFAGMSLGQNSSTTATFVRRAPSADIENGLWVVSQGFWNRDVYFAAE